MATYDIRIGPAVPTGETLIRQWGLVTAMMFGPTINHLLLQGVWWIDAPMMLLALFLTTGAVSNARSCSSFQTGDEAIEWIKSQETQNVPRK